MNGDRGVIEAVCRRLYNDNVDKHNDVLFQTGGFTALTPKKKYWAEIDSEDREWVRLLNAPIIRATLEEVDWYDK